jgi:hypothetical protein
MVENLCRAFFHDARQTKATNGTGAKRRGTTFAVRLPKNARQTGPFAVRHHKKRTANIF